MSEVRIFEYLTVRLGARLTVVGSTAEQTIGVFISRSPPIGTDQHRSALSGPIGPEMYHVATYATGTKLIRLSFSRG